MFTAYNFSSLKKETDIIHDVLLNRFPYYSEEDLKIHSFNNVEDFINNVSEQLNINMSCVDVSENKGVKAAETVRRENDQAQLIVIADTVTSPVTYLKPTIMASALILRPLNVSDVKQSIDDLLNVYQRRIHNGDIKNTFTVKSSGESEYIDFDKILYFEAKDKKTYVYTKRKAIGFYDTLDKLQEILPVNFKRCHRSFIVNLNYIERIEFSRNSIFLQWDIFVPLSRSYKDDFKNIK